MKDFAKNCARILKLVNHSRPKSFDDPQMKKIGESYKEFHKLSTIAKWEKADIVYIRKGVKKFNFAFKWLNGKPIDLNGNDSDDIQKNILNYEVVPAMVNGDINQMMNYFIKYPFVLFDNTQIEYILAQGPYQNVIWKQIQITYCLSQMINGFVAPDAQTSSSKDALKQSIYNEYSAKLHVLREEMENNAEFANFLSKMENDRRFDKKVGANKMDASKIQDAKNEVLSKFADKGLKRDDPVFKIVDMITSKLDDFESGDPGSMVEQIMDISQDISKKLEGDVSKNQDDHQETVNAIKSVFSDAINDPKAGDEVPQEFKNIAQMFFNNPNNAQATVVNTEATDEIYNKLENIIMENELDRGEFYRNVTSTNGNLDVHLLEQYLTKLNLAKQK